MKVELGKPVQWTANGAHHVGRLVLENGIKVSQLHGTNYGGEPLPHERVLVAHSHTRELEFVPWHSLSDYPSEPIPEPGQ